MQMSKLKYQGCSRPNCKVFKFTAEIKTVGILIFWMEKILKILCDVRPNCKVFRFTAKKKIVGTLIFWIEYVTLSEFWRDTGKYHIE